MTRVVVFGASGFVGEAAANALTAAGTEVSAVHAPRLSVAFDTPPRRAAQAWATACADDFQRLQHDLSTADVVVNAAGLATPTDPRSPELWGANAVLPAVIALARPAGTRLVHVSSAAVLGSVAVLDERPFTSARTPYASAKGAGELALADEADVVVYRPTSVLGIARPIARRLSSVLRAGWLAVPKNDPRLPVALVENVGAAIACLATVSEPPPIVLHPWEGMTVARLAEAFGRPAPPRRLPTLVAAPARAAVRAGVRFGGPIAGKLRRLEMLWEGQEQRSSLPTLGFDPGDQFEAYQLLGEQLAALS